MKIACISLGCPKNQVDLDVMVHILLSAGYACKLCTSARNSAAMPKAPSPRELAKPSGFD